METIEDGKSKSSLFFKTSFMKNITNHFLILESHFKWIYARCKIEKFENKSIPKHEFVI